MSHIFISYSKKDIEFARHLRHMLQDHGFAVWMDETRLVPSDKWWPTIERNINSCAAFIVIMSPNSQESSWVEREILVAEKRHKTIFPVLLQGEHWSRLGEIQYQEMMQGTASRLDDDFVMGLEKIAPTVGAKAPPPLPEPVIGTGSVPLPTPSRRIVWMVAAVIVLIIGSASAFILSQGTANNPSPTIGVPTDNVTASIIAGEQSTEAQYTRIVASPASISTSAPTVALRPSLTTQPNTPMPTSIVLDQTIYTVVVGDTLPKIAALYGVAVEDIRRANNLTTDFLQIGQRLTIPVAPNPSQVPTILLTDASCEHTVQVGEWFYSIARLYNIDPLDLVHANPLINPNAMQVGDKLIIPNCDKASTSSASIEVTSNTKWIPSIRKETYNGVDVELVLVPIGCFQMGSTNEQAQTAIDQLVKDGISQADAKARTDMEKPTHRVCFDRPFWIDRYEVTNAQYGSEGEFKGDKKPRESLSWTDANAFCTSRDARLPTEAEWEYAARGPDNLVYPWGNEFVAENVVSGGYPNSQTANVGSKKAGVSWTGAYDLSGNVFEWVTDWYGSYSIEEQINPKGVDTGSSHVLRGGAWNNFAFSVRAANRNDGSPDYVDNNLGFRCARDYE